MLAGLTLALLMVGDDPLTLLIIAFRSMLIVATLVAILNDCMSVDGARYSLDKFEGILFMCSSCFYDLRFMGDDATYVLV